MDDDERQHILMMDRTRKKRKENTKNRVIGQLFEIDNQVYYFAKVFFHVLVVVHCG
jgi:hypothetical protein